MSITVKGTIYLDPISCSHCANQIRPKDSEFETCNNCGALFKREILRLVNDTIEAKYTFEGFTCMNSGGFVQKCPNVCPSPYMLCEEHSSEEAIDKQKSTIITAKQNVEKAQDRLRMMEQSRKTWIILKLSGINEDDSISKS